MLLSTGDIRITTCRKEPTWKPAAAFLCSSCSPGPAMRRSGSASSSFFTTNGAGCSPASLCRKTGCKMVGRLRVSFCSSSPVGARLSPATAKSACCLVMLLALVSFAGHFSDAAGATNPAPRIGGTYLQLLDSHQDWTTRQWNNLFDEFAAMRISKIVVQWSVSENLAFFTSRTFRHGPNPPLEAILGLADTRGMKVLVGLWNDP